MIVLVRVDDRFIHGQVATNWIREVSPDFVLEADDALAANDFLKMLQRTSCPKDTALKVETVETAIGHINGEYKDKKVFLLIGKVEALYKICQACPQIKSVDVGNLGFREGKTKLINRLFVNAQEKDQLKQLAASGVELYAQMIPQEPKDALNGLLLG